MLPSADRLVGHIRSLSCGEHSILKHIYCQSVTIAYMIFNEYSEIWQTGIKNCLNKSFLWSTNENYFITVLTFFTDQYLKHIMLNMSKISN